MLVKLLEVLLVIIIAGIVLRTLWAVIVILYAVLKDSKKRPANKSQVGK